MMLASGMVLNELALCWNSGPSFSYKPSIRAEPKDQTETKEYNDFTYAEETLLQDLVGDAWCVFNKHPRWRDSEAEIR